MGDFRTDRRSLVVVVHGFEPSIWEASQADLCEGGHGENMGVDSGDVSALLALGWSLSWVLKGRQALARGTMSELLREEVDSDVYFEISSLYPTSFVPKRPA